MDTSLTTSDEPHATWNEAYLYTKVIVKKIDVPAQEFTVEAYLHVFFWLKTGTPSFATAVEGAQEDDEGNLTIPERALPLGPRKPIGNCDTFEHLTPPYHKFDSKTGYGKVVYHLTATINERFELHRFPFDRQLLKLKLSLRRESDKFAWHGTYQKQPWIQAPNLRFEYEYRYDHLATVKLADSVLSQWIQCPPRVDLAHTGYAQVQVHLERRSLYYISHLIVPIFLIVLCNLSSFQLDREELEGRINITLTLMLTTAAAQYIVADMLPVTNALTILDKYIMLAYILLTVALVLNVIVNKSDEDTADFIDLVSTLGLATIWGTASGIIFVAGYTKGTGLLRKSWEDVASDDQILAKSKQWQHCDPEHSRGTLDQTCKEVFTGLGTCETKTTMRVRL